MFSVNSVICYLSIFILLSTFFVKIHVTQIIWSIKFDCIHRTYIYLLYLSYYYKNMVLLNYLTLPNNTFH